MDGKKIIFITGTDTGVGKTLLTALLLRHLRQTGVNALAMKPFCSGGRADLKLLQSLQPGALSDAEMNPFYFAKPVAPLVAQKGRPTIRLREVIEKIREVRRQCDCLLIEGSGGLLVPLGPDFLVADLIESLKCRVIIAARNQLGTINHTLLTAGELLARGLNRRDLGVVLMSQRIKDASCSTNQDVLTELLNPVPVLKIPFLGPIISSEAGIIRSHPKLRQTLGTLTMINGVGKAGLR
ncbi:MAG TPA: dethiobiotin synthase [Verrucomicrobiae bacterium]|jgi:dethiobiotin synthetase|nr:dethiobiotin synthase [Verrucomicrobiae bacterium]